MDDLEEICHTLEDEKVKGLSLSIILSVELSCLRVWELSFGNE